MLEFSSQTVTRYRSSMPIKLKRPWKDDSLLEITAITISLWNSSSVKQSVDLLSRTSNSRAESHCRTNYRKNYVLTFAAIKF